MEVKYNYCVTIKDDNDNNVEILYENFDTLLLLSEIIEKVNMRTFKPVLKNYLPLTEEKIILFEVNRSVLDLGTDSPLQQTIISVNNDFIRKQEQGERCINYCINVQYVETKYVNNESSLRALAEFVDYWETESSIEKTKQEVRDRILQNMAFIPIAGIIKAFVKNTSTGEYYTLWPSDFPSYQDLLKLKKME